MIRLKRSDIFPLRVTNLKPVPNRYPTAFANRLAVPHEGTFEPGNDLGRFWFSVMIVDVVVGKRDVEWILPRNEIDRHKMESRLGIWAIDSPVTRYPAAVPRAFIISNGIIITRLFADPKNRCRNSYLPCVFPRPAPETILFADRRAGSVA